jgi:hypothetical protein
MSKGVILVALGHNNYKKMASVLAASIRVNDPGLPVSIITDTEPEHAHLFDKVIIIQPDTPYHYYKLKIYDLSPYKKTIYLDVDMVMLPGTHISTLFDDLDGVPFSVMNQQREYCIWAEAAEVRRIAGNAHDPMYVYYSEIMYFEKGTEAKKLFKDAQKEVSRKIEHRAFAGGMADELALILAAMKNGIKPHSDNWRPVFWHFRDKNDAHMQPYQLKEKYYAYSIGGNQLPSYVKSTYNNLAKYYFDRLKLTRPYQATDKRYFLTDRTKI